MTSPTKAKSVANRSSDTKQGEGWWMASDRRWYPPELHPSYKKPADTAAPAKAETAAKTAQAEPAKAAATAPAAAKSTPATKPAAAPAAAPAAQQATAQPATTQQATTQPATTQAASAKAAEPAAKPAQPIQIKQATPTPQAKTNFQTPPSAPTSAPAHASSGATGETAVVEEEKSSNPNFIAGLFAGLGALLTILGSLLPWANNTGDDLGVGPFDVSFSGFDSSGKGTLALGILLLLCAALLVLGVRPGWVFGALAAFCGVLVLGVVLYSYLDITGKASDAWANEVRREGELSARQVFDAGIGLKSTYGLWATAVGGLLGVLTPPFVRRDADPEDLV